MHVNVSVIYNGVMTTVDILPGESLHQAHRRAWTVAKGQTMDAYYQTHFGANYNDPVANFI